MPDRTLRLAAGPGRAMKLHTCFEIIGRAHAGYPYPNQKARKQ